MSDIVDTGARLIAASKVDGATVYDAAGDKVGTIHKLMIDKRAGRIEFAIMVSGGFLGIGVITVLCLGRAWPMTRQKAAMS